MKPNMNIEGNRWVVVRRARGRDKTRLHIVRRGSSQMYGQAKILSPSFRTKAEVRQWMQDTGLTAKLPEPAHGYCVVCKGSIVAGVMWTFTGMLQRVHADPDDCIAVLRPKTYQAFMKANPHYVSKERYSVDSTKA